MNSGWSQTKIVLDGFFDLLACGKCKKTPIRPMRYTKCGHYFCDVCIYGDARCFQCKTPVKIHDIQPYWMLAQLIDYCQIIKNVTIESEPNDLKRLAKAVRLFSAEHNGIVPETDSESEDETVESTPPGIRGRIKNNLEHETCRPSFAKKLSQEFGEKNSEEESAGYVDPTQFLLRNRKRKFGMEIGDCGESLKSGENNRKQNLATETVGYVDPTQFSPCGRRKKLTEERERIVNSPKISLQKENKQSESETATFVDPTQFSPRKRKQSIESESIGYVDPTQLNKTRNENEIAPETSGFRDHTQTPTSHKKKRFPLKTRVFSANSLTNEERNKNSSEELSTSYVDPTQAPTLRRKIDLQSKNARTCMQKNNSEVDRVEFVETESSEKNDRVNLQPEFLDSEPSYGRTDDNLRSTAMENHDPVEHTLCSEKTITIKNSVTSNSTLTRRRSVETAAHPKNSMTESSVETDCTNRKADVREKSSIAESIEKSTIDPDSLETNQRNFENSFIPETLRVTGNTTNYDDCPMEIENNSTTEASPINFNSAKIFGDDTPNFNENMATCVVSDDTAESMTKLERIKNVARNQRNKNRKLSHDRDTLMESGRNKEKSLNKQFDIDNFSVDDKKNTWVIPEDPRYIVNTETYCVENNEFDEETPSERLRRTRNFVNGEKNLAINDAISANPTNSAVKTLETEKRTTRTTKDLAVDKKNFSVDYEISRNIEERTKISDRKKKPLEQLENVENSNIDDQVEDSAIKCKRKVVKLKTRKSVENKTKAAIPKTVPKNVNKRNAKGETPLHTACVKGQEDYVRALLEAGANPNTKDNANWTPLQEAINLGRLEICKMLLQAGASANTPAMDNRTALHDASANDKLEEAALLLRFNANRNVYDKFGKSPLDYAISDEMRTLLADDDKSKKITDDDSCVERALDQSIIIPNAKVVVLPSNLGKKNRQLLAQLALKLKIEVVTSFRTAVTHVVVETNERNTTELTYDVMLAILQGKWILNSQWITISTDLNDISEIDFGLFEVHGAPNPETPTRARVNEEKQNPRLFNNCFFYFAIGPRCKWSYEKFEFTKESLTNLVVGGQGEILHREPDPEDVKDYKLTPFHVSNKPIHPLYRCSHYIIYMPGKDEPRVKYNMPHIKTLPVGWFLECIDKFALVDPLLMGIS